MKRVLHIVVDNREPKEICEILEELEVEVEVKQLEVGDYDLGNRTLVERKTGNDYVSSLSDGRLFEQAKNLTENADTILLILEDFQKAFSTPGWEERKKHVFGSILYLSLIHGIFVFPTSGKEETAAFLERACSWIQEEKEDPLVFTRGVRASMTMGQKQSFLLQGLPKIGSKSAKKLLEAFKTPVGVLEAILNSKIIYTKTGNPKGIEGPLSSIPGFGPAFLEKCHEMLLKEFTDETTKEK